MKKIVLTSCICLGILVSMSSYAAPKRCSVSCGAGQTAVCEWLDNGECTCRCE